MEAALDVEQKSGRCTEPRHQYATEHLAYVKQLASSQHFVFHEHDVVVATPEGTVADLRGFVVTGELHVFASPVPFRVDGKPVVSKVRLDVRDPKGYSTKSSSSWEQVFSEHGDSRVIQLRRGEQPSVTVFGKGCTLVVALEYLGP